jgi:hypothetical protein
MNAGYSANSRLPTLLEKIMKKQMRLIFGLALLLAAMSTAMFAADNEPTTVSDNSYLYLVQGIPGLDYSTTVDPTFPVDVLINDEVCAEHSLALGVIAGPLSFASGSYDVKVSPANTLAPCTNSPIIDSTVTLPADKTISAVIALSSTGTPTLITFTNVFSSVAANVGRVLFALAADSPAVQLILENTATSKLYTYSVNPGALLNVTLPSGNYTVEINQGTTTLVASTPIVLSSQSAALLFAVGQASNNTVTLETKIVKDVI